MTAPPSPSPADPLGAAARAMRAGVVRGIDVACPVHEVTRGLPCGPDRAVCPARQAAAAEFAAHHRAHHATRGKHR